MSWSLGSRDFFGIHELPLRWQALGGPGLRDQGEVPQFSGAFTAAKLFRGKCAIVIIRKQRGLGENVLWL